LTYIPMGPPPPAPPQGLCFGAPWPWGMGEQSMPELKTWWIDRMEGGEGGGAGLRFFLQFDPGKVDRTLLGVSLSALFSRLLGWTRNGERRGSMAIAEEGGESAAAAAAVVSAAALAAAVSVCFAAMHASGQRPRRPRHPRRPPLSAAALGGSSSAARPRALPSPDDGLRILSSKDESLDNVIHGASIGAGDDEPVIVARVKTTQAGANADDETEHGLSEEERQETERLRELWLELVEREQMLELRLQELKELRDQEETVRELEDRVAVAATEARLLQLRVASLQEENGNLRAQLEELDDARAQLASAKEKLREIKARVEEEHEEAAALQAKVAELERGDEERAIALAAEAAALREANAALEVQNIELALRLQDAEQAASSVNLALEEEMVEEATQLRETNETLTREIERLRSDHCAHVEELVYLKWVNACLRHELSGDGGALTAGGGKGAMDLSKSMSFRSSERAKQLMLRYGHPGLDSGGFDPALFSPLHESMYGDELATPARNYAAAERSPAATSVATTTAAAAAEAPGKKSGTRNKIKFLGNFKKLLPGGGKKKSHSSHGHGDHDSSKAAPAPPPSDEYLEKAMRWLSAHDVLDVDHSYETTPLSSCDRTPPSSVTTATPRGGGRSERVPAAHEEEESATATLARSRSDAGASYGREASRYHSLRPDHPAADETGAAPEVREPRRRSEELRTRGAARA
ncbi:hypothetical protein EJB05_16056, partial [Eragrostis curvula]